MCIRDRSKGFQIKIYLPIILNKMNPSVEKYQNEYKIYFPSCVIFVVIVIYLAYNRLLHAWLGTKSSLETLICVFLALQLITYSIHNFPYLYAIIILLLRTNEKYNIKQELEI